MNDDKPVHEERRRFLGKSAVALAGVAAGGAVAGTPTAQANEKDQRWPRYDGKVVLITGATSGIGEAAARIYAEKGASVFFCGRREDRGRAVQESIRKAGGKATYMRADVREEKQVKAFVEKCVATYGALDIAFNNAGIEGPIGPLHEVPLTGHNSYQDVMRTNTDGVLYAMRYEIPVMQKRGGGVIVNTGSLLSHRGSARAGAYAASKHAVIAFTRSAASAEARNGIRILSISPGGTHTELAERFGGVLSAAAAEHHPMGRIAQPEDIANALINLTDARSTYLTGEDIRVDGGMMA